MSIDHIEDDPSDPDMCIAYLGYGTSNQIAMRRERASLLFIDRLPSAFIDYDPEADQ